MAKFHNVNQLPLTGPLAMFSVKTTLVAAGWSITKSGDGLALYSASGDIITGGGAVAGGLGNVRAYFTATDPATKACLSFQTMTNTTYRVKYSETGFMAGGAPNSTTVGSATDEQILYGGGTDSSPTGTQMLHTDNAYRFHVVANSTPQSGSGTYPFWFGGSVNATGVQASFFALEGVANGTANPLDTAPRIIITWYVATGPVVTGWGSSTADTNFYARAWVAYGLAAATFKRMAICHYTASGPAFSTAIGAVSGTENFSTGPYATEDQPLPVLIARHLAHGTLPGPKGFCSDIKYKTNTLRDYPSTILNATNAYAYFGGLLVSWPEAVSPLL